MKISNPAPLFDSLRIGGREVGAPGLTLTLTRILTLTLTLTLSVNLTVNLTLILTLTLTTDLDHVCMYHRVINSTWNTERGA